MTDPAKKTAVNPLRPADFGLSSHKVRQFNAFVPGDLSIDDLEDPALWANVATQIEIGSEIRCLADDMSFVAYGIVTFAQGSDIRLKILSRFELDAVTDVTSEGDDYEVKLRGPRKWSIVKKSTGEVIKEDIANQAQALVELNDYRKALRR